MQFPKPAHELDGVVLPNLLWRDEFDWQPVARKAQYALDGSLIVQEGVKKAGRPITLAGESDFAWVRRSTVLALQQLAAQPSRRMQLKLKDGRTFWVMFAPDSPIAAQPLRRRGAYDPDDVYVLTLKLVEIQ